MSPSRNPASRDANILPMPQSQTAQPPPAGCCDQWLAQAVKTLRNHVGQISLPLVNDRLRLEVNAAL